MKYWAPIPGYEGYYYINREGLVCNRAGHLIKPVASKSGNRVELRKFGQRDRPLIKELLQLVDWGEVDETI